MGRYGAGTSGYRCNGQRSGGAIGVAHRQNRIGGGGFYDGQTNNLGIFRISACYGIGKIRTVQGKDQLTRLGNAYLEQHLISADFSQVEGRRAKTGNAPGAVRAVLGEADIRPGGDGSRIIRGHQGVEIGIGKYAASRALGTNWAGFADRTLGASWTSLTHRALRAGSARCADGALRTSRASFTDRPLRASRTDRSGSARCANGALRTGRTSLTGRTLRASGAGSAGFAGRTLGADGAGFTGRALRADGSGDTGRALRSGRTGHTGRTSRPGNALGTHRSSGPNGTLGACRTLGGNGILRHIRVSVAAASIKATAAVISLAIA